MPPSCVMPPGYAAIFVDPVSYVVLVVLVAIASFVCYGEWNAIIESKKPKSNRTHK